MGYRSDGLWVIKGPIDQIKALWVKLRLGVGAPMCDPTDGDHPITAMRAFKHGASGYIELEYQGWKWYGSYPDIMWFEWAWNQASEMEESGVSGRRLRLGEDAEDIEDRSFGEWVEITTRTEICNVEPRSYDHRSTPLGE